MCGAEPWTVSLNILGQILNTHSNPHIPNDLWSITGIRGPEAHLQFQWTQRTQHKVVVMNMFCTIRFLQ